jgi:hypothetical protein
MTEASLYGAEHPLKLRSPLIFDHPYDHAGLRFVGRQRLPYIHDYMPFSSVGAEPSSSSNNYPFPLTLKV